MKSNPTLIGVQNDYSDIALGVSNHVSDFEDFIFDVC